METHSARGRSVLVTGASSGIGASCSRHLAELGYRVYAGARSLEALKALSGNAGISPLRLDVTSPEDWRAAAARIEAETAGQGLYALINNAGSGHGGPVEYLPLESFREQFEVNYFGVIQGIQACMPLLRQYASGSRIVNVSSVNGRLVTPFLAPYCSSKFALEALSESLRYELTGSGIHCSLIQPGMIRTPIFAKSLSQLQQLRQTLPAEALTRYAHVIASFERVLAGAADKGTAPEAVATTIARVLSSKRPRLRYSVGRDAQVALLLRRWLSDGQLEALIGRVGIVRKQNQV